MHIEEPKLKKQLLLTMSDQNDWVLLSEINMASWDIDSDNANNIDSSSGMSDFNWESGSSDQNI